MEGDSEDIPLWKKHGLELQVWFILVLSVFS